MAIPLSYNVRSLYIRRKLTMLAVGGIFLLVIAVGEVAHHAARARRRRDG